MTRIWAATVVVLCGACGNAVPPVTAQVHGKKMPAAAPAGPEVNARGMYVATGSGGVTTASAGFASRRPRLVVVIALDQFRADYLTRYDAYFGDGGFKRLLARGAAWTGHYGHYATYTGPGHALLLSGSYPYVNGIAANKFYNAESSRSEAMVFDASAQVIGAKTDPDMDVSPRNFVGSTVGDELSLATGGKSKTIALATKGRGAILLGGRLGKTYFMNDDNGEMTSSTYYMRELPGWVSAWNKKKLADAQFGKSWDRALPEAAYATASSGSFPHVVNGKLTAPGPAYYEAYTKTPWANDWELDFARAAVEGEKLGARGVTDVLAISLWAIDLAGHDYGPSSQEVQDLVVRTDRQLADFLGWLTTRVPDDELTVLVTADHGATPVPEQMAALGFDAGRIKKKAIKEAVEGALTKRFGAADPGWVVALEDPHVFLNRKHIEARKLDAAEVQRVAGEAAAGLRGIGGFVTRTQLVTGALPPTALAKSLARSYFAARGGDVVLWTLPFYFWGKYGEKDAGSTHGTWYRYDAEVPVLLSGPGVRRGRFGVHEMVDVAPTLAHLLGLVAPAGSEGDVLRTVVGEEP